jgi:hypothetical protein
MATAHMFNIIVQGHTLDGGQSHFWKWNNSNSDYVYSLAVQPLNSQNNSSLEYKAEVRNVRYLTTGKPAELEVHFEVHNWGTAWCDYFVRMAAVGP